MLEDNNKIPRPVRPSDYAVIALGFTLNLVKAVEAFCEDVYELAIYSSNRTTKTNAAWQEMAQDLEKLQEDTDGR